MEFEGMMSHPETSLSLERREQKWNWLNQRFFGEEYFGTS
jgi:hypothetical protein